MTPLHVAAMKGNHGFASSLLKLPKQLASIDAVEIGKGATALMFACINKLPMMARMLLKAGAAPSIITPNEISAIFFAVMQNELSIVKDLCAYKAKLFVANGVGQTILDIAIALYLKQKI